MGIGGISIWQLLIILLIVVLIFGTKRLKNIGGDLGGAMKGFKDAMKDGEQEETADQQKSIDSESSETTDQTATSASEEKIK